MSGFMPSKRGFMKEKEIQKLERMDPAVLGSTIFSSVTKAQQKFIALLGAYRVAANVANAAWLLAKHYEKNGTILPEHLEGLREALVAYSPANFNPLPVEINLACVELERLYDDCATITETPAEPHLVILERIWEKAMELRKLAYARQPDTSGS